MKTALQALIFLGAFFFSECWLIVPSFQTALRHAFAWFSQAPILIFGAIILVLIVNTWKLQRRAKWGTR